MIGPSDDPVPAPAIPESGANEDALPRRRARGAAPKIQDLAGLRVLLEGRGPTGAVLRGLEAARDLAEHGAEVVLVDHGLAEVTLAEIRRRAPHAEVAPAAAADGLLAPRAEGPPPRFVLLAAPGVAVSRPEARKLMAVLGRSTPGAAVVPVLQGPNGAPFEQEAQASAPLAWMARRAELASGVRLRLREHRGAHALVERPDELASTVRGAATL